MMTSTFPSCRSNQTNLKNGLKEIQIKKESLIALEAALKKRINELRDLCLREGQLTGHLPVDYPLQPREPIPQVRRRIHHSYNNLNCTNSVALPSSFRSRQLHSGDSVKSTQSAFAIATNINLPFPSRPTSTNSSNSSNSTSSSISRVQQPINLDGLVNFQPYYEESKPFQMSDFYKYSSKHRQKASEPPPIQQRTKTTRQLQEEVLRKNSHRFSSSCDDQIQASKKLIEKSGQKLIAATAKAIASNPGLAEKLNSILPNNGDRF